MYKKYCSSISSISKKIMAIILMVAMFLPFTVLANDGNEDVTRIETNFVFERENGLDPIKLDSIDLSGVPISYVRKDKDNNKEREYSVILDESVPDDSTIKINFTYSGYKLILIMRRSFQEYCDEFGLLSTPAYSGVLRGADEGKENICQSGTEVILEGGKAEITLYCYLTIQDISMPYVCTLKFDKKDTVTPELTDAEIVGDHAQWMRKDKLFGSEKRAALVTTGGASSVDVDLDWTIAETVKVDGEVVSSPGSYSATVNLLSSEEGTDHTIELMNGSEVEKSYTICCYKNKFTGMPDKVTDYMCVNSQYTNNGQPAGMAYGNMASAVGTLRGGSTDAKSDWEGVPVSLGNAGGYITYYYDDPIMDDPKSPYGIDFIVHGNSASPNDGFAEPGSVQVSEDGETWYKLAGSLFFDNITKWDQTFRYEKTANGKTKVLINGEESGTSNRPFPEPEEYPLFSWQDDSKAWIELKADLISPESGTNEYGNTLPSFPDFGYADCGIKTTSNKAYNPYVGLPNSRTSDRSDGFDLAWAVDSDGSPVELPNGVHYVKIITSNNIENGAIGEKSTEVCMVRKTEKSSENVKRTSSVTSIMIDGQVISGDDLKPFEMQDVTVDGIFDIKVNAGQSSNVYINGRRTDNDYLEKAPHGIVRIIVQDGEKEPVIYYFRINQNEQPAGKKISKVKLSANWAGIEGKSSKVYCFDEDTLEHLSGSNGEIVFPVVCPPPIVQGQVTTTYRFLGWKGEDGEYHNSFNRDFLENMGEETTLTLDLEVKRDDYHDITVSCRLVGATLSSVPVDLGEGTGDSEYQTWCKTEDYTVPAYASVGDVFMEMVKRHGLTQTGAESGYISTIYAPEEYGGYKLSEFTNGPYSGWMYTKNGEHTNGINIEYLDDGDELVFHYVNDYRFEVHDWARLGGAAFPQLGFDESLYSRWLLAEDINPDEYLAREEEKRKAEEEKEKRKAQEEAEAKKKAEEEERKKKEAEEEAVRKAFEEVIKQAEEAASEAALKAANQAAELEKARLAKEKTSSNSSDNASEERAAKKKTTKKKAVLINAKVVTSKTVRKALKKANNVKAVTITLGKKVKKIKKGALKGTKIRKMIIKTRKLKKKTIKGCFRRSRVKIVKVNVGSKNANKKYVKRYRRIFIKKVVGRKVKVK